MFSEIISLENLLLAWYEFRSGKRGRQDVRLFERHLEGELIELHQMLRAGEYRHGGYERFHVFDPKHRIIHKARIRDRVVHHALYRVLYPVFDPTCISDSYSCRIQKGTHRAVNRLASFIRSVGRNGQLPVWTLKCDIKKFFDSIDHERLFQLLEKKVADEETRLLLKEIISSYRVVDKVPERERESSWSSDRESYFPVICKYLYESVRSLREGTARSQTLFKIYG